MSGVGIYPTLLDTTIHISLARSIVGVDPAHQWHLMLECVAQGSRTAGAAFAEQHRLLGFRVDHFNRVTPQRP